MYDFKDDLELKKELPSRDGDVGKPSICRVRDCGIAWLVVRNGRVFVWLSQRLLTDFFLIQHI